LLGRCVELLESTLHDVFLFAFFIGIVAAAQIESAARIYYASRLLFLVQTFDGRCIQIVAPVLEIVSQHEEQF